MPERDSWNPGYGALKSLARGITEEGDDDVFISLNDLMDILNQVRYPANDEPELMENKNALVQKCRSVGLVSRQEAFKGLVNDIVIAMLWNVIKYSI